MCIRDSTDAFSWECTDADATPATNRAKTATFMLAERLGRQEQNLEWKRLKRNSYYCCQLEVPCYANISKITTMHLQPTG